jgi:hypothetical protein
MNWDGLGTYGHTEWPLGRLFTECGNGHWDITFFEIAREQN